MNIELPYPDKVLSPNSRCHWAKKASAAKNARAIAFYIAKNADKTEFAGYEKRLHLWIDIYPKTKNYPDADNMLSSLKSALDGIADALELNDRRFIPHPFVKDETHKGGRVAIRITKGAD
jgi:crossover junction endodeoxyribonuclease RusA